MNAGKRGVRGDARRQTMIEPDQIQGSPEAKRGPKRRQTIMEEASPGPVSGAFGSDAPATQTKASSTQRFNPSIRPPVAKLFVLDDSGKDAEVIRIRTEEFRIGRAVGDLVIGHDGQMSSEHAVVQRREEAGRWTWHVVDLDSTNGTFVRVTEVPLENEQEFWLGGSLYRFQLSDQPAEPSPSRKVKGTMVASTAFAQSSPAALIIEVTPEGDGPQYALNSREQWIGRNARKCAITINDPMLGTQDSNIFIDAEGNWGIRKGKSLNGIWVRITEVPLVGNGLQFQCGEQRFALRID